MYRYEYKGHSGYTWNDIKNLEDFHNVSFPMTDNLSEEELLELGITRTEYIPPQPTPEEIIKMKQECVRGVRDRYLLDTDYTQLPDSPFTQEEKANYKDYRQYLRNYTTVSEWWERNPKTYEEWKNVQ